MQVKIQERHVERLEADLCETLAVRLRVERRLSHHEGMFFWGDAQLAEESMMPNFLHVVPVGDLSRLDWVLEEEDIVFLLGFVTHEHVLLVHADHDSGDARTAHYC